MSITSPLAASAESAPQRRVIRCLPPAAVNRIAAGEVVERPAAAVKELVENALDAGADRIDVVVRDGGRTLLSVRDDGCGMDRESLSLCLERHATSKLEPDDAGDYDLLHIGTMGFRGEALPSIGSVSRLVIASRTDDGEAWEIDCQGGTIKAPAPASFSGHGTLVTVRDLFYATPARLKFLKTDQGEARAIADAVKAHAMARPDIAFSLDVDGRRRFAFRAEGFSTDGHLRRLSAIMGEEFRENALTVDLEREGTRLSGFAGVPTFNRGQADRQYLFVNGRPVRDRLLLGAVRGAYADFLARDRHPLLALFVDLPYDMVDVNVHPTKAEVRFRDAARVRGMIVSGLRAALAEAGHRASTTVAKDALGAVHTPGAEPVGVGPSERASIDRSLATQMQSAQRPMQADFAPQPSFGGLAEPSARPMADEPVGEAEGAEIAAGFRLGAARAQLHETYIVAQTADGIVLVDQHAAHERLVYEQMKRHLDGKTVPRQALLVPEVVSLTSEECTLILGRADELAELGLVIENFGGDAVLIREVPALFGGGDVSGLVRDIAADLEAMDESTTLKERLGDIAGNMACRGAIKAGRRLTAEEMNHLLREMEATPHSGQCNHGRPTYVELKLHDIEKLFGRR